MTTFQSLLSELQFNNGTILNSKFVMAPMVAEGSSYEGYVGEDDLAYFNRRSKTASLLITGATAVADFGNAFGHGLASLDDTYLPGLTQLATTMKQDGAKAVLQLFHPGRQARYSFQDKGLAYGPSNAQFSFLDYPTTALSNEQITTMIQSFADATSRAIKAGFDGVEIHGANHYLIQQFFSTLSNTRTDEWGGTLEKRAKFALDIVKSIKKVIVEEATTPFILGYRISPEEVHGEDMGYTLDDSLYLIDEIAALGVDYLHISLGGPNGYAMKARAGSHLDEPINKVIHNTIANRAKQIVVGDITSPEKALDALNYGDLVALASVAIVEPDFKEKISQNKVESIDLETLPDLDNLKIPKHFGTVAGVLATNQSIPEKVVTQLKDS